MRKVFGFILCGVLWTAGPAAAGVVTIHNCTNQSHYFDLYNFRDNLCMIPLYFGTAGTVGPCDSRAFECGGSGCKVNYGKNFYCSALSQTAGDMLFMNNGDFQYYGYIYPFDSEWERYCDCPKSDFDFD